MARHGTIAEHVRALLDVPVVSTTPVAGGDICTATRVRLGDGRNVFVKTLPRAPAGFFATEASGLDWLADATTSGGVGTPRVLGHDAEYLVLEWLETARSTPEAGARLGAALAATHRYGAAYFGAQTSGFVGTLPAPNTPTDTWLEFFAACRIEPYVRAGRDRGALTPDDATAIEAVLARLGELAGPAEPPARLHGDLWAGNVVWTSDGVPRVVDPAAHGGHRETDLAMLALFGAPHVDHIISAYDQTYPLADGWPDRVGLHQLHPLLVHAVLFGGGYGSRAGAVARDLLAPTTPSVGY